MWAEAYANVTDAQNHTATFDTTASRQRWIARHA